jgi:hypothetical protein
MSRIYGESVEKKIRLITQILLICFICFLMGCSKEENEPICKTCTLTTTIDPAASGQPTQTYIESQTKYCNGEYNEIEQGQVYYKKTSVDGGLHWTIESKVMKCE